MLKKMFKSTATVVALIVMVGASLSPSLTAFADSVAKSNELIFKRDSSGNVVAIVSKNGMVTPLAASYVLPAATSSVLGGVIADGSTITVTASGVITAVGGGTTLGPAQVYTASHVLAASDVNTASPNTFTSASALTVTVPLDATLPTSEGDEVSIAQMGSGAVTVSPASGVTVSSTLGYLTTSGQYAVIILKRLIAADNWILVGDRAP